MLNNEQPKYYLVEAKMLPEIFIKVVKAKELLQTGQAATVSEATSALGISRSAFYKYRDSVTQFKDIKGGRIITFNIILLDKKGSLSSLLSVFADTGANILTISQSIPVNGIASATITAETTGMQITLENFISKLQAAPLVKKVYIAAG